MALLKPKSEMTKMQKLNIFIDETGEFDFDKVGSKLYGVSFTFHEQKNDITNELNKLNKRLNNNAYTKMIHMSDLIMRRGDYKNFSIEKRKSIFNSIYQFSRKIPVKYTTIIVNKKYTSNRKILKQQLFIKINELIKNNEAYFQKFDKIIMYYDNGQEILGTILDTAFLRFNNFTHKIEFGHQEKRLFQVSDVLIYRQIWL